MTRMHLALVLGVLWCLDGLLQLQPAMLGPGFARSVIGPAAAGQMSLVAAPMLIIQRLGVQFPILFTLVICIVQLGLGVAILVPRTCRVGLWTSVVWGLGVWAIGEGYSGLASGHAFMLSGSPGAALIYVILALGVLIGPLKEVRPHYLVVVAWAAIWCVGGLYQLLPGQDSVADIAGMIVASAHGAPGWLAGIDASAVTWLAGFGHGTGATGAMTGMPGMVMGAGTASGGSVPGPSGLAYILAVFQLLVGLGVFFGRIMRRVSVVIGCGLAVVFWVVGQGLGMWYGGYMTDPNSGPLLVILGLAVWGGSQKDGVFRARLAAELAALNEA